MRKLYLLVLFLFSCDNQNKLSNLDDYINDSLNDKKVKEYIEGIYQIVDQINKKGGTKARKKKMKMREKQGKYLPSGKTAKVQGKKIMKFLKQKFLI